MSCGGCEMFLLERATARVNLFYIACQIDKGGHGKKDLSELNAHRRQLNTGKRRSGQRSASVYTHNQDERL